jgi:hypothetical protein
MEQFEERVGQQMKQQQDEVERRLEALERDMNETVV